MAFVRFESASAVGKQATKPHNAGSNLPMIDYIRFLILILFLHQVILAWSSISPTKSVVKRKMFSSASDVFSYNYFQPSSKVPKSSTAHSWDLPSSKRPCTISYLKASPSMQPLPSSLSASAPVSKESARSNSSPTITPSVTSAPFVDVSKIPSIYAGGNRIATSTSPTLRFGVQVALHHTFPSTAPYSFEETSMIPSLVEHNEEEGKDSASTTQGVDDDKNSNSTTTVHFGLIAAGGSSIIVGVFIAKYKLRHIASGLRRDNRSQDTGDQV